jgi:hypothetical protein
LKEEIATLEKKVRELDGPIHVKTIIKDDPATK